MPIPSENKLARAMRPAIVAVACVLATAIAMNAVVQLVRATPQVGDIVAFAPSSNVPDDDTTRLLVHRRDQFGCVLDLNVLRYSGGSLVIEAEVNERSALRVHWAGLRTSAGPGNCGSDAELIVDHRDMDLLALAAGGYGVGPKRPPMIASNVVN